MVLVSEVQGNLGVGIGQLEHHTIARGNSTYPTGIAVHLWRSSPYVHSYGLFVGDAYIGVRAYVCPRV